MGISEECTECVGTTHTVLIVDPFLKKAFKDVLRESGLPPLRETEPTELLFSQIYFGENGSVALSDSQYLGEALLELKVKGIRKIVLLDVATSIKTPIKVANAYPVYAAAAPRWEDVVVPPVPNIPLFNKVVEAMGAAKEVLSFTTRMPLQDLANLESIKKKGFDVVDKNSAFLYSACQGRLECAAVDLIDSNVPRGIEKEVVWDESSKYYPLMIDVLRSTLNKLLSLP